MVSLLLTAQRTYLVSVPRNSWPVCPGCGLADPSTNPLSARRKFERDKDTLRARYRGDHHQRPEGRYLSRDYTHPRCT